MRPSVEFADRRDAGRRLAAALQRFRDHRPLVLALPRGGVPVAFEVAQALGAELDLIFARKIGAPDFEEYGLGAVVDDGSEPLTLIDGDAASEAAASPAYLQGEVERQVAEIARARATYLAGRASVSAEGQTTILVDDGAATGGTARAALRALRRAGAATLVLAIPVGPKNVLEALAAEADEAVWLCAPERFQAVSLHYGDFDPTSDAEVLRLLSLARRRAER